MDKVNNHLFHELNAKMYKMFQGWVFDTTVSVPSRCLYFYKLSAVINVLM